MHRDRARSAQGAFDRWQDENTPGTRCQHAGRDTTGTWAACQ